MKNRLLKSNAIQEGDQWKLLFSYSKRIGFYLLGFFAIFGFLYFQSVEIGLKSSASRNQISSSTYKGNLTSSFYSPSHFLNGKRQENDDSMTRASNERRKGETKFLHAKDKFFYHGKGKDSVDPRQEKGDLGHVQTKDFPSLKYSIMEEEKDIDSKENPFNINATVVREKLIKHLLEKEEEGLNFLIFDKN